jgi:aminomethyltransferase
MHKSLQNVRFSIKPQTEKGNRPVELARTMSIHPLTYQELPFDPEYSHYAGRLTTEKLSNASPDEQYWKTKQEIILRHTGEHPYEISGPDALKLLQKIFPRDISKVKKGRCSYQFACYHDGGIITDGLLLRIDENCYWFAQADGDMFSWYKANSEGLDVKITEPNVFVSQIQGPKSMELLNHLIDEPIANTWKYFDWVEITMADEKVIISRTGFTNELGWEIYFRPENDTEKLGDLILSEGAKMGMIITATPSFRGRRIEAGLLSAGQDFTSDTNPFSVGLGRFVDLEKDNFIGKKALRNADKECRSWGIRVVDGIAKKGRSIIFNNQNIGKVTSSTWSPYQVCGVGIVLLDKPDLGPETVVDVECTDEKIHKAELCKLPMYDPKGEIVRGINKKIPTKPEPWVGIKS